MMKKTLYFLAFAAVILLLPFAVHGEAPVGNDDDLTAILNRYRESEASAFDITLTPDYFDQIRDNSFLKLSVLTLKCGMLDQKMKYSYSGELIFEDVKWGDTRFAECADIGEAESAVSRFLEDGSDSFRLLCGEELSRELDEEFLLYSILAMRGVEDFDLSYSFSTPRIYQFDNIRKYSIPYATARDDDSFLNAVNYMWRGKADHFYIVMDPDYFSEMRSDYTKLELLAGAGQIERYRCGADSYNRRYEFSEVTYTDEPCILCRTEEEIQEAVRQMGAAGIADFRLVLPGELFGSLQQDSFSRLESLTAEAGMTSSDMQYAIGGSTLYYRNAVIRSDTAKLTTAQEAMEYAALCAARGDEVITLYCEQELYDVLMGDISPLAIVRDAMAPLYDITAQAGVFRFHFTYSAASGIINITVESYYPGTKIIRAVQSGNTSMLTGRESETMHEARRLAEELQGDTPLETARRIHDWLCANNTYTDDDTTDEDDTAVGAVLNGQANCDGYADAFFLIGTLAGLNVRYQHGDSYPVGLHMDLMNPVTHMWNLLEIDGTWRLVDVTWDDGEDRIQYTWFNIGEDRAGRMHIRNAETGVPLRTDTDLSARPENEFWIQTADDAEAAFQDIREKGYDSFSFIYESAGTDRHPDDLDRLSRISGGGFRYSWNERMLVLSVSGFTAR